MPDHSPNGSPLLVVGGGLRSRPLTNLRLCLQQISEFGKNNGSFLQGVKSGMCLESYTNGLQQLVSLGAGTRFISSHVIKIQEVVNFKLATCHVYPLALCLVE